MIRRAPLLEESLAELAPLEETRDAARDEIRDGARPATRRAELHVVGLHHAHTPLAVRERYALDAGAAARFLNDARAEGLAANMLALSTCNRVELYAVGPAMEEGEDADAAFECANEAFGARLRAAFLNLHDEGGTEPEGLFALRGAAALRHLFEVGAGLDSMLLGETQIKKQLREACAIAHEAGMLGGELRRAVDAAFRAGKRIRTETQLNVGTLSLSRACVLKGAQTLGSLVGKKCLVIGAGKFAAGAARAIAQQMPAAIWVVNRTVERARELAASCGGEANGMDALPRLLGEAEFVLAAAFAPELTVRKEQYEAAREATAFAARDLDETLDGNSIAAPQSGVVCMVDAAVPRSLDPAIAALPGVSLFHIEQLEEIVATNRQRRAAAAERAQEIVEDEVARYVNSVRAD